MKCLKKWNYNLNWLNAKYDEDYNDLRRLKGFTFASRKEGGFWHYVIANDEFAWIFLRPRPVQQLKKVLNLQQIPRC